MARPRSAAYQKNPKAAIGAYPEAEIRPKISLLGGSLDKSDGEFLAMCAEAIVEMVESKTLVVPPLVRTLRVLRETGASLNAPAQPFPTQPDKEANRRDKKDVSLGYPKHIDVPRHAQISAGRPGAHTAPEPTGTINVPAGVARVADFAVEVSGDSMEPLVHAGEIAVFRKAEQAGNGQIVAALVEGEMMLKRFCQKNGGPARLESLNKKYPPIVLTTSTRIQGLFEGKFSLH